MSEEDTQIKASPEFHESMKKEGVDEITAEKEAVKGDKEVTKNGLDTHKSENKQNSINIEISKENESKNVKTNNSSSLSEDVKEDETEEPMDGIEEEEKPHDATPNSDHEDLLNDSKNETLDEVESAEESKLDETLEDSRDESPIKKSRKRENDDSSDRTPVRGKRERKKVERFVQEAKKEEVEVEGHGTALGDIPFIKTMIAKNSPENLKILHRICYARPGTAIEVKRNLYKFRGFPFSKDDKLYERKKTLTEKIVSSELKRILVIFGLERKGVKMDLVERTLDFLLNPQERQKHILKPKHKQSKKDKGKKRKKEAGKKNKAEEEEDQASDSDEDSKSEDEEGDEEEEEENESDDDNEEEEEPESEEEEKVVKSRKKSTPKATPTPKKSKTPQPKKTPKAQPAKPQPKSSQKKKAPQSPSPSEDSDSEDSEPLAKKVKKSPTDAEIKTYIKKLLDKADLEQVTMKKVCQLVYEHYPGQDLSYKKDFIKATVKSILS